MKVAPLVRELMTAHKDIAFRIIHTGQHYDPNLSEVFFRELEIPNPNYHLGIATSNRLEQIEQVRSATIEILRKEQPNAIIVVGDVNSTLGASQAGKETGVKVAHVEAGLRSFDMDMPEEHNRIATDQISDLLYVTEQAGIDNLKNEKIAGEALLVGNAMIDTLVHALPKLNSAAQLAELGLKPKEFLIATFHRPSNVDTIGAASLLLEKIELCCKVMPMVLPLHPRTSKSFTNLGLIERLKAIPDLTLIDPIPYFRFMGLIQGAAGVVTDSGGIQEETTFLGIPCLTLRKNTERPSTTEIGSNELIGDDVALLKSSLERISSGTFKKGAIPPLWDGKAATRIIAHLRSRLT